MRILILAGGEGTRLRPLTNHMPKIMVPIHGKPFLYYMLKWLKKHDIVISTGYKGEAIRSWCKENKVMVELVQEPEPLGTGGALRICRPFVESSKKFAVINGDTYIDCPIETIAKKYSGKPLVVSSKSILDNVVRPAGLYIFDKTIFKSLSRPKVFNLDERMQCLDKENYTITKKYIDIGTHTGLKYAKCSNIFKGDIWNEE
jgi:UTP-glucose-1-phosphate uridylyltransferase